MGGDFTRIRFKPQDSYASVRMQQGRVQLDSDWNEQADIHEREQRARMLDLVGPGVIPVETPDGFKVEITQGQLTIGLGRGYFDGILAENHGRLDKRGQTELDPLLGELRGTAPVNFHEQPFLLSAQAPLPRSGVDIAYLDVWEREVTAAQDPDLVDSALGVDTTARLQTVWQVKQLPVKSTLRTLSEIEKSTEWQGLTAPARGRLSTTRVASDDAPPNSHPLAANQLYRIEIHDAGDAGSATFKWSRDNASFVIAVTGMSAERTRLSAERTRRDETLNLSPGDWVEIIDDTLELTGTPGFMRQVASVDPALGTVDVTSPLPPNTFSPADRARHLRIRRWEQSGPGVDPSTGVVAIPSDGSPVLLENGIAVVFGTGRHRPRSPARLIETEEVVLVTEDEIEVMELSLRSPEARRRVRRQTAAQKASADYRAGDYWVFATRTGGYLEELTEAPPRGIHHHYCPLAIVTYPDHVVDCRVMWPRELRAAGDSDCLTAEAHNNGTRTIQDAIDDLSGKGGTVCLESGVFVLKNRALDLKQAHSIRLQGQGWSTILLSVGRHAAIEIDQSTGIVIQDLTALVGVAVDQTKKRTVKGPLAELAKGDLGKTLDSLERFLEGFGDAASPVLAIRNSAGVTVERCRALQLGWQSGNAPVIALGGVLFSAAVRDNVLVGLAGVANTALQAGAAGTDMETIAKVLDQDSDVGPSTWDYLVSAGLDIERNSFYCQSKGVSLEGFSILSPETRITANRLFGCEEGGILVTGMVPIGADTQPRADGLRIADNTLRVAGDGIVVGTEQTRVEDNDIGPFLDTGVAAGATTSRRAVVVGQAGNGVVVYRGIVDRIAGCAVVGNRVRGMRGHGVAIEAHVGSLTVSGNALESLGGGGVQMSDSAAGQDVIVRDNQLRDVCRSSAVKAAIPIRLTYLDRALVTGNLIDGVGLDLAATVKRYGIFVDACGSVHVLGNQVDLGMPSPNFAGSGIFIDGPFSDVDVTDNRVRPGLFTANPTGWLALQIQGGGTKAVSAPAASTPARTSVFATAMSTLVPALRARTSRVAEGESPETVGVFGNLLEAQGGDDAVARIEIDGHCVFSHNRCTAKIGPEKAATVVISAVSATVTGNLVIAPHVIRRPTIDITVPIPPKEDWKRYSVVGNLTRGAIEVNGSSNLGNVTSPAKELNTEALP